ncbi:MAG: bacillithiol biosynthesis BshC [Bryobacterales bacterium]|nr:bacillithiol biosynthesis BshC [Bryobacterales bacterium]
MRWPLWRRRPILRAAPTPRRFAIWWSAFWAGTGCFFDDPLQPGIRELAVPLLARAVEQFATLAPRVAERSQALESSGYHAQVHLDTETSFFFLLEGEERLNLKARNGGFASGKRSFSTAELTARANAISPSALLRPVLQDYLLPTACPRGRCRRMPTLVAVMPSSTTNCWATSAPAPQWVHAAGR